MALSTFTKKIKEFIQTNRENIAWKDLFLILGVDLFS